MGRILRGVSYLHMINTLKNNPSLVPSDLMDIMRLLDKNYFFNDQIEHHREDLAIIHRCLLDWSKIILGFARMGLGRV